MGGYALGGRFTTLEGLLDNVLEQVNNNPMLGALGGDSVTAEQKQKIDQFLKDLMSLKDCEKPFTIILDDPAGNSYIQVILSLIHRIFFDLSIYLLPSCNVQFWPTNPKYDVRPIQPTDPPPKLVHMY